MQDNETDISLDDAIGKAFDEVMAKQDTTSDPAPKIEKELAIEPEEDDSNVGSSGAEPSPVDDKPTQDTVDDKPKRDGQARRTDIAPQSWTAEMKQKWSSIDPEVQKEIHRRERDISRALSSVDEDRNFGKQAKEIFNPYMPMLQQEGVAPHQMMKDLLETAYRLRTGTPEQNGQLLMLLAKHYNAILPIDTPSTTQSTGASGNDPAIRELQQRFAAMESERQSERQKQQLAQSAAQQAQQQDILQQIQAFSDDPANEFFDMVRPHMGALMSNGQAPTLQEAYNQAIWAHPEIRPLLLERQVAEREAKRVGEQRKKVEAAKRAGSSVSGSPGLVAAIPSKRPANSSLEEDIAAAYDAVMGR